jgi:hypothetical protein
MISTECVAAPLDAGEPFRIGHELTVFEASMIYAGRHPHGEFLRDGDHDDYVKFLRAGIPAEPTSRSRMQARQSWDICCQLVQGINRGVVKPVRSAYQSSGEIDIVRTVIKTSDLVSLAKERGEQPKYLRHLQAAPRSSEAAVPTPARPAYKRERARTALRALWPDRVPDPSVLANGPLCQKVTEWIEKDCKQRNVRIQTISDDTILRAAGRQRLKTLK